VLGPFVFSSNGRKPIGGLSAHKAKLDKASGVTGWVIHDLRRTARSWRFSFCCARDGCRTRKTPPSFRFLGRKVYLAARRGASRAGRPSPSCSVHGIASRYRQQQTQYRDEPIPAAADEPLDQRGRQAIQIDRRHEGGRGLAPERACREPVAPPLAPALHRPAVDADQPSHPPELRSLRALQRTAPASPFIFVSERGSPFTTAGFARLVKRAGEASDMLRHACGHVLANKGTDTRTLQLHLGHRNIQHTVSIYRVGAGSPEEYLGLRGRASIRPGCFLDGEVHHSIERSRMA